MTPQQHQHMTRLVESLAAERQIPLLGSWLVLTLTPWFITLDLAGWWLLGKARDTRLRQGWFAGRLRDPGP